MKPKKMGDWKRNSTSVREERRKLDKKNMKSAPSKFQAIDITKMSNVPSWMTRAFSNNRYIVTIDDNCPTTHGPAIRAMVQKTNNAPFKRHWFEMQQVKNELFGEDAVAVEYYPPESELIDCQNIYWLWIFPPGVLPKPLTKDDNN